MPEVPGLFVEPVVASLFVCTYISCVPALMIAVMFAGLVPMMGSTIICFGNSQYALYVVLGCQSAGGPMYCHLIPAALVVCVLNTGLNVGRVVCSVPPEET